MVSLFKLALETGHFFYCLIVALTLSQPLRRRSAIRSNREKVAGLTRGGSANARKFFSIPIYAHPSQFYWTAFLLDLLLPTEATEEDYSTDPFDTQVHRNYQVQEWLAGIVDELANVETWSLVDDCALNGLLRLKQPTNIAGQDVSKNLLTFTHDEPGTAHYADIPSVLVVTARSTSC